MDERQALLAAVIAEPDEDTPRLVFADWLQEHGDEHDRARAEFIRLQVAAARLPDGDARRVETESRAAGLHAAHVAAWLGPLAALPNPDNTFERGLLKSWYTTAGLFLKKDRQRAVCEGFPQVGVRGLMLTEQSKRAKAVAVSPALAWVTDFSWLRAGIGDDGMKALAASPHTARVSGFLITNPRCSNAGVEAFAASGCWPNLRQFGLRAGARDDRFGYAAATAVLTSPHFPRLEALDLGGTWLVGGPGRSGFFTHTELSRLRFLRFDGSVDLTALATCPHLSRLEELSVSDSCFGLMRGGDLIK